MQRYFDISNFVSILQILLLNLNDLREYRKGSRLKV